MILDMPHKVSMLVCDLDVAKIVGHGPICNNQVSGRKITLD